MNNLRKIRKAKNLTLEQLGDLIGANKSQIHMLETGKTKLHTLWLEKLSRALGVAPGDILGGMTPEPLNVIRVRGYVQAGDWREAYELPPEEWKEFHAPAAVDYPGAFGLAIRGDSMDLHFAPGDIIICAPIHAFGRALRPGDMVVCDAVCDEGLHETTVKEFYIDGSGDKWLMPKSKNPAHQPLRFPNGHNDSLVINGRDIRSVQVIAVVVGCFKWMTEKNPD